MSTVLDIVIPTFNNVQMLLSCVNSLRMTMLYPIADMVNIIIVNNGNDALKQYIRGDSRVKVIDAGRNLGWEGGLKLGLQHSKAPFVVFSNDDIRMMPGSQDWFWKMLSLFNSPNIGAVGPSSNFVMGPQNIFCDFQWPMLNVKYLIGFFMMIRREALEKAGGIDDTLPGGDDIDLSIRLRDAGYALIARRDVFVFHHGQATGQRVHAGYWNSQQMQEKTNHALIRKHGMSKYYETVVKGSYEFATFDIFPKGETDIEGDLCRKHVSGDKILELGCGGRKTDERAVGVDRFPKGYKIPLVTEDHDSCVADLNGDVSNNIPVDSGSQDTIVSRHILEHCQDTLGPLSVWNKALKMGGKLIIAVPSQLLGNTIIMNPEHIVSFTPASLRNSAAVCGFKEVKNYEDVNGISFVSVFEKVAETCSAIVIPEPTKHPFAATLLMEKAELIHA